MNLETLKKSLENKKILILGFGKEGKDSFIFLKKLLPNKVLGIADKDKNSIFSFFNDNKKNKFFSKKKVKFHLGKNYLKAVENYDIIIKSPGIPIHLPEIEKAYKKGKITSSTEIFFENCPGKIIGITGTKGKGTTALLIYQILKESGFKVHLVGNIGKPVLQLLFSATPKDIYVYELSSHQLYNIKKSPPIAVFLNIYPDHLDYYKNFKEYVLAKTNICRFQKKNDYLIYNEKDEIIKKIIKISQAKKIPIKLKKHSDILKNVRILKKNFSGENILNILNINAAFKIGKILKIPKKKIIKAIKNFKPLFHRLEYIGRYQGINFYNDSAATIPEATIFALNSLGEKVETIILGGSEKGVNFKNLTQRILESKIKNVILLPPNGKKIWQAIPFKKRFQFFFVENMKEAVRLAYQYTRKNKTCLLSPASASFGLFRDYKERGNLFKKYVKFFGR